MTRRWDGATGEMSRKASAASSSHTTFAGISFDMILSKMVAIVVLTVRRGAARKAAAIARCGTKNVFK
jgi:hypothetical protein